ncbi:hypothetical protein [Arthrobacter sp. UYCo732]|uniref:hypothetical protein n=1 Tax=Arthrobacter sp. UYCo732 TaxID=3156336 RepID=UPI003397B08E
MTSEYTPRQRALERISRSISEHQAVKREDAVGSTCRNRGCQGVIFLNLNDRYNHQAVVIANDLQADLDWYLQILREDAEEDGREITDEALASARAEYLVLAPAAASDPAESGKDN